MDAVRLGRQLRALRQRRRWRQIDLAAKARVSRSVISRIETGGSAAVRAGDLEKVAAALDARLEVRVWWHGESLDRLLDSVHAVLVDDAVRRLTSAGWTAETEVTFEVRGERGSIDVLGWHPARRMLLVVEVKSAFGDLQSTLMTLDRKVRLVPIVARRFRWPVDATARLLLVAEGRTNRRVVEQHERLFESAFPVRGRAASRWLRAPQGPTSGLLFSSPASLASVRRPKRVRAAKCRATSCSGDAA